MASKMCSACGKRRVATGKSSGYEDKAYCAQQDLCYPCGDEGQMSINHDNGHESYPEAECWGCHPELDESAKDPKAVTTGPKAQGARRPQLNHKGHSHPQTPAARRECKKLFWASMTIMPSDLELAEAMGSWDAKLDGNGKLWVAVPGTKVEAATDGSGKTRPAKWNVAPLGPKGGVGHSLKVAANKASK